MATKQPKFTLSEFSNYLDLKKKFEHAENEYGQSFGYEWLGASVQSISTNYEKSNSAKKIQIQLNLPFCVIALSLEEAKEFLEQQLDAIRELESSYMPKVSKKPKTKLTVC